MSDGNGNGKTAGSGPINIGFLNDLVGAIKSQGLSFMLLAMIVWYFNIENRDLQTKVEACINGQIEMYRKEKRDALEVIHRNTEALEELNSFLNRQNRNNNGKHAD